MNPAAILALISDLYGQIAASQARITELEAELARRPLPRGGSVGTPANGADRVPAGVVPTEAS